MGSFQFDVVLGFILFVFVPSPATTTEGVVSESVTDIAPVEDPFELTLININRVHENSISSNHLKKIESLLQSADVEEIKKRGLVSDLDVDQVDEIIKWSLMTLNQYLTQFVKGNDNAMQRSSYIIDEFIKISFNLANVTDKGGRHQVDTTIFERYGSLIGQCTAEMKSINDKITKLGLVIGYGQHVELIKNSLQILKQYLAQNIDIRDDYIFFDKYRTKLLTNNLAYYYIDGVGELMAVIGKTISLIRQQLEEMASVEENIKKLELVVGFGQPVQIIKSSLRKLIQYMDNSNDNNRKTFDDEARKLTNSIKELMDGLLFEDPSKIDTLSAMRDVVKVFCY